jgi:hypothetical protein
MVGRLMDARINTATAIVINNIILSPCLFKQEDTLRILADYFTQKRKWYEKNPSAMPPF